MSHLLALALLGLDSLVRAWRIQLAVWTAGGRLGFQDAVRLNLYGEAASTLTPNRLGAEPPRVLGPHKAPGRTPAELLAIPAGVGPGRPRFSVRGGSLPGASTPPVTRRAL